MSLISFCRGLLLASLLLASPAMAGDCSESTEAMAAMPRISAWPDSNEQPLLLADDARTRQAGMQWLCPETVKANPMLFVFARPRSARFHGNNVFVDLDLAWLDADGRVLDMVRLPRRGEAIYDGPVAAVLEASVGSFERWGLKPGMRIPFSPPLEKLIDNAR